MTTAGHAQDAKPSERGDSPAEQAALKRRSILGLNGLNFFVSDMQTAFGPFVTVYLTANGWKPSEIGVVLGVGTIASIAGQVPVGMLVDAVSAKRLITGAGILMIILSSLVLALFPDRIPVFSAEFTQGVAGALLTPAIAAMTLALSTTDKLSERLGGNVRWKALGSMLTAILMGYIGSHIGAGAVFFVAAIFGGFALACLFLISGVDITNAPHRTAHPTALHKHQRKEPMRKAQELWRDPLLLAFAGCTLMFQLSNAAVLPFAISAIHSSAQLSTDTLVAIALVVSQAVTVLISPKVGSIARARGRKVILMAGYIALTLRCVLLSINSGEYAIIAFQLLDGISAATIGVSIPLVVSDITHNGGRFNFGMGVVGLATAIGATLSTTIAGYVTELFGTHIAFLCLAAAAVVGVLLVQFTLPETGHTVHPHLVEHARKRAEHKAARRRMRHAR